MLLDNGMKLPLCNFMEPPTELQFLLPPHIFRVRACAAVGCICCALFCGESQDERLDDSPGQ